LELIIFKDGVLEPMVRAWSKGKERWAILVSKEAIWSAAYRREQNFIYRKRIDYFSTSALVL